MSKERDKEILELLVSQKQATVKELAAHLFVSEPSIRRDLAKLEKQNLIKRVHGGAIIEETALSKNKIPLAQKETFSANRRCFGSDVKFTAIMPV